MALTDTHPPTYPTIPVYFSDLHYRDTKTLVPIVYNLNIIILQTGPRFHLKVFAAYKTSIQDLEQPHVAKIDFQIHSDQWISRR